ncbi:hypothetical protein ACNTMW_05975 [Planosporangium sp. 12N6]|uniref:hypothetical protein n=1 Tax=Planosporangium spinosum TaxID=3402278 RepID=UPI003CEA53B8
MSASRAFSPAVRRVFVARPIGHGCGCGLSGPFGPGLLAELLGHVAQRVAVALGTGVGDVA